MDERWKPPAALRLLPGAVVARLANLGNDLTHAFCRTPDRGDGGKVDVC
jgi:hypothetical protein